MAEFYSKEKIKDLKAEFFDEFQGHTHDLVKLIELLASGRVTEEEAIKVQANIFERIILLNKVGSNIRHLAHNTESLSVCKKNGLIQIGGLNNDELNLTNSAPIKNDFNNIEKKDAIDSSIKEQEVNNDEFTNNNIIEKPIPSNLNVPISAKSNDVSGENKTDDNDSNEIVSSINKKDIDSNQATLPLQINSNADSLEKTKKIDDLVKNKVTGTSDEVNDTKDVTVVDKKINDTKDVTVVDKKTNDSKDITAVDNGAKAFTTVINNNDINKRLLFESIINDNQEEKTKDEINLTDESDNKSKASIDMSKDEEENNSNGDIKKVPSLINKNDDLNVKAILVNEEQFTKLKQSKSSQLMVIVFSPIEFVTREQINKMMKDASTLYKNGKVVEAQKMYEKIRVLNKKLIKSKVL